MGTFMVCSLRGQQIQYPLFSLYTPGFYNPANYARQTEPEVFVTGRQLFAGVERAPVYALLNGSMPVPDMPAVAAASLSSESKGLFRSLQLTGSYCYNLKLEKKSLLSFGLSAAYVRRSFAISEVLVLQAEDPVILASLPATNSYFVNAGIAFSGPRLSAGVSIPNITGNKIKYKGETGKRAFYSNTRHVFANISYCVKKSSRYQYTTVFIDVNARYVMHAPFQFDAGMRVALKEKFSVGLYYRSSYALGALFRFDSKGQFYAGYGYDYILKDGKGRSAFGFSHELLLGYKFISNKKPPILVKKITEELQIVESNGKPDTLVTSNETNTELPDSLISLAQLDHAEAEFSAYNGIYVVNRNVADFYFYNGNKSFSSYYIVEAEGYHYGELIAQCPVVADSVESSCDVIFDRYSHKFYLFNKRCYELNEAIKSVEAIRATKPDSFILFLTEREK